MSGERRNVFRKIVLYYFVIPLIILFADQLSKFYVRKLVLQGSSVPIIGNIFHITFVYNRGAAFGMFRKYPHLFVVIAVLAAILIVYLLMRRVNVLGAAEKTALCFILGGTLSNLMDRIRFGAVIDFIDFRIWPVFNFADTFITIGAVILAWKVIVEIRRR